MKEFVIEQYCDGWKILVDEREFYYNHNDEDLGVTELRALLGYLGHKVTVEECY